MEISGEKTKIMTNNINGMTTALHIAGNTLDEVQSFKYLGAIISEEGSKPEVLARIAQATAALSSLKKIWRDRNITLRSKNPPVTFACDIYLPICMRKLDTHRRPATSNTSNGDEMLPKTPQHIVHRTHNKCGGTQQNRACHWTIRRLAYYCQKKKAKMVWPCLKVFWSLKNDHAGYSQRRKEKGWPEKAMGR